MSLSLHIEGTEEVPERYDQNHILKDIRVKEELRSVQSRLIISIIATFGCSFLQGSLLGQEAERH